MTDILRALAEKSDNMKVGSIRERETNGKNQKEMSNMQQQKCRMFLMDFSAQ